MNKTEQVKKLLTENKSFNIFWPKEGLTQLTYIPSGWSNGVYKDPAYVARHGSKGEEMFNRHFKCEMRLVYINPDYYENKLVLVEGLDLPDDIEVIVK